MRSKFQKYHKHSLRQAVLQICVNSKGKILEYSLLTAHKEPLYLIESRFLNPYPLERLISHELSNYSGYSYIQLIILGLELMLVYLSLLQ